MTPSLDLLVLAPHPDDAELACGGLLALSSELGQTTGVIDLTAGELATNGTVVQRADEAEAARRVLGVTIRENLGLPDGGLDAARAEHLAAVVGAIRRHRPLLLCAPWTSARHPDHAAAGELAHKAVFFSGLAKFQPELGAPHRPARLLHYAQRRDVRPDLVVDVSDVYERKRQAIACHVSQFGAGAATAINDPVGGETYAVRDRYWGATIGVRHGEAYWLGAPVPITDPVSHFRHLPSPLLWPPR